MRAVGSQLWVWLCLVGGCKVYDSTLVGDSENQDEVDTCCLGVLASVEIIW